MFTAIQGGAAAIQEAARLLARRRRGNPALPVLAPAQITEQLGLATARVMAEAGLYAPLLAGLALKQAQGDAVEAVFLLRAFRATLDRLGTSLPLDLDAMPAERALATVERPDKGGQILGATYDFSHRLLDFALLESDDSPDDPAATMTIAASPPPLPSYAALVEAGHGSPDRPPFDITAQAPTLPPERDQRLQALARGEEGFLAGVAYSSLRGYGRSHPYLERLRIGFVALRIYVPELGDVAVVAEVEVTEAVTIHTHLGGGPDNPPRFVRGYGLAFGRNERRAVAMAILDHALRVEELGGTVQYPAQDAVFVLAHADGLDAAGLVQHFKLPHHVDFQAELQMIRRLRDAPPG